MKTVLERKFPNLPRIQILMSGNLIQQNARTYVILWKLLPELVEVLPDLVEALTL
ncbi:MAG: hypothetical protein PHY07_06545 [Methanosarcina sp.]|nr:hypothetical protein [Methanosarcina sp.]